MFDSCRLTTTTLDRPRILVLGDVMLDRTITGSAERTSPEAPVVVLRKERTVCQPGGATAVAQLLQGLDLALQVEVVGVVGADVAAEELRSVLNQAGIGTAGLITDLSRPTTVKERFIGLASGRHGQQVLRVDHESTADLSPEIAEQLWSRIEAQLADCDVVLVSDYAKGVCTSELLERVIQACHWYEIPVHIDPARRLDVSRYTGADLIKPNRTWLEMVLGRSIADVPAARQALEQLRQNLGWRTERLLLTLDRDGMVWDEPGQPVQHVPAQIRQVSDVTGAGDLVQAVLGACLTRGLAGCTAVDIAVAAAGLEVERPGIAPVSWHDIESECQADRSPARKIASRSTLRAQVATARAYGKTIVFTNGCFDLLHAGHVRLLQHAKELGEFLIVAINSDASVRRIKGTDRPFISQAQRAEMLAALACVDLVIVFDEETPIPLLRELQPDVLVKGGEYAREQVVGWEVVDGYGGRVVTVPMLAGWSTTQMTERIQACATDRHSPTRRRATQAVSADDP